MKNYLFLLIFITLNFLQAQTISLEWTGLKDYHVDYETTIKLPYFKTGSYSVREKLPYFTYSEETTNKGRVRIENVQYALLSSSERGNLNVAKIPSEFVYQAGVLNGAGKLTVNVEFIPFIKEGNQIKKVTSFQIVQDLPNFSQSSQKGVLDNSTQSPLRNGTWYKIKISESGVYRLDKSFFDQNGIPTNFDPRTLKIYGNGGRMLGENPGEFRYGALQENAIQIVGEEDGVFNQGDYVIFYAQGPHTWNRKSNTTLQNLKHRYHLFSDYAYYFITFDGAQGKRIQDSNIEGSPAQTFNQYHEYQFYENDSVNLNGMGKQWGGRMFNLHPTQSYTLTGSANATGEVRVGYRALGQNANGSNLTVTVNGTSLGTQNFTVGLLTEVGTEQVINSTSNTFNFNIQSNIPSPNTIVALDYIYVKYLANLTFNGSQMHFRRLENLNDGNIYGFALGGAQRVWNISDITNAQNVVNSGGIYKYRSNDPNFLNEFIAFNESALLTNVEFVGEVKNQNTRAYSDVEYVIVTHPQFVSEAARLANFRQQNDGLKVAMVTTEQVYNDFSSGAQDISAIRDFFKHLRDSGNPIQFALLLGGASYDFKDRIPNNTNFVPAYQSYNSSELSTTFVTDDFFTLLDDDDILIAENATEYNGFLSAGMDIAIGRMPAHNLAEAKLMVDKTIAYYEKLAGQGTSMGDWKTKFHLVVDDDNPGEGSAFHTFIENSSAQFIENTIPYATLRKLYMDAFPAVGTSGGQRYPQINQGIANAFDLGSALILYFGHGGPRSWSQERVITFEEITNFSNFTGLYSRLPVVLTITCDFTVWDIPEIASAGEYMYKAPQGGASAMMTTSRPIGVSYGIDFNENVIEAVLAVDGDKFIPLGEGLRKAKIAKPSRDNYSVNLLGDTYLSVTRPKRQIRITKINGVNADEFDGVLRALDFVEIEGEVLNSTGVTRDHSFNGKATATLFDKPVTRTTLNNDGNIDVLTYKEQINAIFKGGTNVSNGQFKFQFYVPKDINYEVGDGKLTIYAHNNLTDGVTTKVVKVGDQNPDGLNDDKGPAIGLYMNNLNFVDGGITDRDPYLLACLVDDSGINMSGIAIGHDITAVLDGDVEGTYVLNEYYEGGDNNPCTNPQVLDYQKGQVMYKLSRLELGNHQILFKAWDINNNSSTQTLDFVVMEDGSNQIYIDKLLNWPNPFTNQTYFHFEHNCDTELDVMVQIFTVSGKLVKTIRQTVTAEPWREGYRTGRFAIPWDGLDDFGDKIGKGVYIYRVTVKGLNPDLCKGSATAIEKLVILK